MRINETKLMDTLDKCVSEFFMLEGTTERDKKEFIEHIREAQKTLALVTVRNFEEDECEVEEKCSLCTYFSMGYNDTDNWCIYHNCYTCITDRCVEFKHDKEYR